MPPVPTPPDPASALQAKAAELGIDAIEQVTSDADGILKQLLGPVAEEAGQIIAMPLREMRLVKTAKMLQRVEEKIQVEIGKGAERVTVPARGVVPLIEAASLEDDKDLSDLYVDLLSNAALGNGTQDISSFAAILKQLGPADAALLQFAFNSYILSLRRELAGGSERAPRPSLDITSMLVPGQAAVSFGEGLRDAPLTWTTDGLRISVDNLIRLGLLRDVSVVEVRVDGGAASYFTGTSVSVSPPLEHPTSALRESLGLEPGTPGEPALPLNAPIRNTVLQPTRDKVALSDLGLAFSRCVNSPGIEIPAVVVPSH